MSYFEFLALFLGLPLLMFLVITWSDQQRARSLPKELSAWPLAWVILLHVLIAVIYTTPWDNYLVATQVWWYDPNLVTGITIGYVPIEEYTFFILQTIFTGLLFGVLARRIPLKLSVNAGSVNVQSSPKRNLSAALLLLPPWIWSLIVLFTGWQPGNYLALILVWALPPIALQLFFGADLLWQYRRVVLSTLLTGTFYLAIADSLAISVGTWTISPEKTLGVYLAGVLPIEEFLFFLFTNILVSFGITLVMSRAAQTRAPAWLLAALTAFRRRNRARLSPRRGSMD